MNNKNVSFQTLLLSMNITNLTKPGQESVLETVEEVGDLMNFYYVPFLVLCGSFGNIFSLVVFSRTKLSKLSSSYYLSALALSDTCFLFGLFTQWLKFFDLRIYDRPYFCQFFTFFSNLACFCSAWFVVAFTVERFIAVIYPLRRQVMCTIRRAKITLAIMIILGTCHCVPFAIYSAPIYIDRMNSVICDIRSDLTDNITMLNYWDTLVVFAVPFAIIAIVNTLTCCTVWKFGAARRMLVITQLSPRKYSNIQMTKKRTTRRNSSTRCAIRNVGTHNMHAAPTLQSRSMLSNESKRNDRDNAVNSQIKITRMLMIVSTAFVTLNLPSCIMRIKTYLETQSAANTRSTITLQYIFHLLFITNFGINFYLYCLSGQNFRKEVWNMIHLNGVQEGTQLTGSLNKRGKNANSTEVSVTITKFHVQSCVYTCCSESVQRI